MLNLADFQYSSRVEYLQQGREWRNLKIIPDQRIPAACNKVTCNTGYKNKKSSSMYTMCCHDSCLMNEQSNMLTKCSILILFFLPRYWLLSISQWVIGHWHRRIAGFRLSPSAVAGVPAVVSVPPFISSLLLPASPHAYVGWRFCCCWHPCSLLISVLSLTFFFFC